MFSFNAVSRRGAMALLAAGAATPAFAGDRPIGKPFAGRSTVMATGGMAATSQPLATQAALKILAAGGTAVDAAIAANACLGLMEPTGCGLGGDLFALVRDPKTGKVHALNASGPAPTGMSLKQLTAVSKGPTIPALGWAPVTVPGAMDGWRLLHEKFGKLTMAEILAPAIGYARDGFPVSPVIADGWRRNVGRFTRDKALLGDAYDNVVRTWTINGETPASGRVFKNSDLARTLTNIAAFGRGWFYEGEGARQIEAFMKRIGGPLRASDLAAYRAEWVEPISTSYRGHDVWQCPPNGQGITVLQMLNILEGYDLKAMGFGSADALHVMAEAKKAAFRDRARLIADPRFAPMPSQLLDKAYAAQQRAKIDMAKAGPAFDEAGHKDGDTIYLATGDASGMLVSFIQSNYRGMGSGLIPDGLGFGLQNRGAQFSLDPKHANAYAPKKRPFHTIIPGMLTKDGTGLAFGVMGGDMQPQGHTQIVTNVVDFGMDIQEAGDAPRWRHIGGPDPGDGGGQSSELYLESQYSAEARAALAARGHKLVAGRYEDVGGYQAVMRKDGVLFGASEMRKDGQAAGI
ncbi:MAG: gamma-glutamyltransferase family protein [Alphaproteobacteria bacterium]|nr:gamma-glutamyltransferase family protein [Alphaproteobacteria bacterium]